MALAPDGTEAHDRVRDIVGDSVGALLGDGGRQVWIVRDRQPGGAGRRPGGRHHDRVRRLRAGLQRDDHAPFRVDLADRLPLRADVVELLEKEGVPYVLTGVMLGCAKGAYEMTVGDARKRNATNTGVPVNASQAIQIKVAEASARIAAAEMMMKAVCAHAMDAVRTGREVTQDEKVRYRRDAFFSTRLCLEAVDLMMVVAGSGGLYQTSAMQRLFRDAHAANAHVMFSPDLQGTIFGSHELGVKGPPPLM